MRYSTNPVSNVNHANATAGKAARSLHAERRHVRPTCAVAAIAVLLATTGCLNPNLVNATSGGLYPVAPGDEPFLLVRVINDTSATLEEVPIVYDNGFAPPAFTIRNLSPGGRETGVLLNWPVFQVAIGSLADPMSPAILAVFPDGSTNLAPFGRAPLRAGIEYERGDTIIFRISENNVSPVAISVSAGLIDGDTEPASYSRGNPFETVRLILQENGFVDVLTPGQITTP
ncbi:MAG: hypothetical protein JXA69_07260 [Phycisphaerae bacterium]|nr:hypothetical protein [Phycisphaerae bacterium]